MPIDATGALLPHRRRPGENERMPYAEGRIFHDADSHVMETPDWLAPYADPPVRERFGRLRLTGTRRGEEPARALPRPEGHDSELQPRCAIDRRRPRRATYRRCTPPAI